MASTPFVFDEELFASCASSPLAAYVAASLQSTRTISQTGLTSQDEDCLSLLEQHTDHYGLPPAFRRLNSPTEMTFRREESGYTVGSRLARFIESVLFVDRHNRQQAADPLSIRHRVTLNQFSHLEPHELPLSETSNFYHELLWNETDNEELQAIPVGNDEESVWFARLVDAEELEAAAMLEIGKGGFGLLDPDSGKHGKKHKKKNKKADDRTVRMSLDSYEDFGSVPFPMDDERFDGKELMLKPAKTSASVIPASDPFATNLNWATDENPDGVHLVHDSFDQGKCGACWAFAVTGTLETSASRREANDAYNAYLKKHWDDRDGTEPLQETTRNEAVAYARQVERSSFDIADLSVQELIDCDTAADQGCTGGNPLLSFYFIHRYGLTSWNDYPYEDAEHACRIRQVSHPIVTVRSWGIISSDHEDNMAMAIRYFGPIAVGVNGGDPSFLSYVGGIYDNPSCAQEPNHAMLIVGYGEEKLPDGSIERYWIARNSWGKGWGEDGFVRIRRGDGRKGSVGVCGIAKSPSVALGGELLNKPRLAVPSNGGKDKSKKHQDPPQQWGTSSVDTFCSNIGFSPDNYCDEIASLVTRNRAVFLGLFGILCSLVLVAIPLSRDCRRRRRRRLAYRRRLQLDQERVQDASARASGREKSPLLASGQQGVYGSGS